MFAIFLNNPKDDRIGNTNRVEFFKDEESARAAKAEFEKSYGTVIFGELAFTVKI